MYLPGKGMFSKTFTITFVQMKIQLYLHSFNGTLSNK